MTFWQNFIFIRYLLENYLQDVSRVLMIHHHWVGWWFGAIKPFHYLTQCWLNLWYIKSVCSLLLVDNWIKYLIFVIPFQAYCLFTTILISLFLHVFFLGDEYPVKLPTKILPGGRKNPTRLENCPPKVCEVGFFSHQNFYQIYPWHSLAFHVCPQLFHAHSENFKFTNSS